MKRNHIFFLGLILPLIFSTSVIAEVPVDQSIIHEANGGLGSSIRQQAPGFSSGNVPGNVADACAQFRSAGIGGVADITGLGATGGAPAAGAPAATPTAATAPINPNPAIADITTFVTTSCTSCHGATVTGTDAKTARINVNGKPYSFAEALGRINANPRMEKVKANGQIVATLTAWSALQR